MTNQAKTETARLAMRRRQSTNWMRFRTMFGYFWMSGNGPLQSFCKAYLTAVCGDRVYMKPRQRRGVLV